MEDAPRRHASDALAVTSDAAYLGKLDKCSAASPEDVSLLLRVIALPNFNFFCPLCDQSFRVKKSLIRHINSVIAQYQGSPYQCTKCHVRCARKDILTRHVATMHPGPSSIGSSYETTECGRCGQLVRPRSLKGHQSSARCTAAAQTRIQSAALVSDREGSDVLVPLTDQYIQMSTKLHEILNCEMLTGWLFAMLQPWGQGQDTVALWYLQGSVNYTYEMLNLKAWVLKAMRSTVSSPEAAWHGGLFDSILLLLAVVTFTDGFNHTWPHQEVLLRLIANMQAASKPSIVSREAFVNRTPSDALTTVIFKTVPESQRWKCQRVFHMAIRMLRSSAYDYTARISNNFEAAVSLSAIQYQARSLRPEEFAGEYGHHMVAIGEVAAAVNLAELTGEDGKA